MNKDATAILDFIKSAEKLKTELRHSWTSDKLRQESVADHSWMLALMALLFFDYIDLKVDRLKVMKMVILHDLAEAVTGDIPTFEQSERNAQNNKHAAELAAMQHTTAILPSKLAKEILGLWQEFEDGKTDEAKMAQSLDKIEVLIQHTIADIDTWDDGDYWHGCYHNDEKCDYDPFIRQFKDLANKELLEKLEDSNTLGRLRKEHIERYEKEKQKKLP